MTAQNRPCPRCGGADRLFYGTRVPGWHCRRCRYYEPEAGNTQIPARPALTPAQIADVHYAYTVVADRCAALLWEPEGAAALAYLRHRGLSDDAIRTLGLGYHPADGRIFRDLFTSDRRAYDAANLAGLTAKQGRPLSWLIEAITLPYEVGGQVRMLRTRKLQPNATRKYLVPPGLPYFAGGLSCFFNHDALSTDAPIILTEGEIKAAAVISAHLAGDLRYTAIAVPGGGYLPDELVNAMSNREVVLCYDSERRCDPFTLSPGEQFTIRAIERTIGAHLPDRIAGLAQQLRVKGLDDQTRTHLEDELAQLETQQQQARARNIRIKVLRLPRRPDVEKVDLDSFLTEHGPDALADLIARAPEGRSWYGRRGTARYSFVDGRTMNCTKPVANYQAVITEDVELCDGLTSTAVHRLALLTPSGVRRDVDISGDVWAEPRKAMQALRTGLREGTHEDEGADALRAFKALAHLGDGPGQRTSYTATGWQQVNGCWHYLMPDGAITAHGTSRATRADLEPGLLGNHYALCGSGQADQGAAAWVKFLQGSVCDQPLALLLAGHAALSVLHRFMGSEGRPLLWLWGESGSLKTSLVRAALLSLYGPSFTAVRDDGGAVAKWDSTANGLSALAFTYRDAPLLIDDYKQATAQRDALARFLHNYSESTSRTRMTKTLRLDVGRPPRCIAIVTGEDRPSGDIGQIARTLQIAIARNDVRPGPLADLQRAGIAGDLAAFWRGFVQDFAAHLDTKGEEQVRALITEQQRRDDEALPGHMRSAGALRQNRAAWLILARWMVQRGYLTQSQADALSQAHVEARRLLAENQERAAEDERPSRIFLDTLREGLASGDLVLLDKPVTEAEADDEPLVEKSRHRGRVVGFRHKLGIAIFPSIALSYVQEQRNRQRQPLNYTSVAIWAQLAADGEIARANEIGRHTCKVKGAGRVLMLRSSAIEPDDEPIESWELPGSQSSPPPMNPGNLVSPHQNAVVPKVPKVPTEDQQIIEGATDEEQSPGSVKSQKNRGNFGNQGELGHQDALNEVPTPSGNQWNPGNRQAAPTFDRAQAATLVRLTRYAAARRLAGNDAAAQTEIEAMILAAQQGLRSSQTSPPLAKITPRTVAIDQSRRQELIDAGCTQTEAERICIEEADQLTPATD